MDLGVFPVTLVTSGWSNEQSLASNLALSLPYKAPEELRRVRGSRNPPFCFSLALHGPFPASTRISPILSQAEKNLLSTTPPVLPAFGQTSRRGLLRSSPAG